jgi:STE24 endopeptidase
MRMQRMGEKSALGYLSIIIQTNGLSRYFEHRTDQDGLEVIHGIVPDANQAAAQAFQALGENTYSYPYPYRWLIFWTYDHPPIPDRVQFVLHYTVPRFPSPVPR